MIRTLLLLFIISGTCTISAQTTELDQLEKIAEVRMMRNQYFMEKLNLKSTDTADFFKQYDAHLMEMRKLKKVFRKKWSNKSIESLSETESKNYYADAFKLQNEEMQMTDKFIQSAANQWGWNRAIRIKKTEREIQPKLLKKANDLKIQKKPPVKSK